MSSGNSKTHFNISPVAKAVPFDNDGTDFDAENVQDAIVEIGVSASPGFSWGRSGNISSGTWLQNDSVPSNISGRSVFLNGAEIKKIFVASQDPDTYDISIYYHDGDEINLILITTVSIVAARTAKFTVSLAVPIDKQLALRVTSGSAKNIVAGLILSGSLS